MHAVRAGNVADECRRIGVNDHYVCAARNINTPRLGIDGEIVPTPVATQHRFFGDVVARRSGRQGQTCQQHQDADEENR